MRTSGSILPRESSESEIPARFAHRLLWPSHDTAKRKGPHRQTRMRVLHRDPKTGEIKVRVENPDDLWHLHNLLQPSDLVRASTYRREDVRTDKLRPERGEKVRVPPPIRVADLEFQAFSDRLRISGVIVEGPQDLGRHHTLNVGVEDVLSIIKTWRTHELRRIDEAVAAAQKPLVAFLALDDEEALIAQLRQYGVRELSTIRAPGHGKMFPSGDARTVFFDDILAQVRATEVGEALVLVGPGFTREAFVEYLKARDPPLAAKVHVHGTAHAGMQGIQEALRAGVGAKVFGESRVGYETQLVEKLLEAIATHRPVAYGPAEVQEAADAGAIAARSSASTGARGCRTDTSRASRTSPPSAIGSSSTISSGSARAKGLEGPRSSRSSEPSRKPRASGRPWASGGSTCWGTATAGCSRSHTRSSINVIYGASSWRAGFRACRSRTRSSAVSCGPCRSGSSGRSNDSNARRPSTIRRTLEPRWPSTAATSAASRRGPAS